MILKKRLTLSSARSIPILIGSARIRVSYTCDRVGNKGRNNSFVLRGEDLRAAEQWLAQAGAQKERQPTALQTEYIIASRKAAARRQWITLGAVTLDSWSPSRSRSWRGRASQSGEQETKAKNTSVQADFDLAVMYQQNSRTAWTRERSPTLPAPCERQETQDCRGNTCFAAARLRLGFSSRQSQCAMRAGSWRPVSAQTGGGLSPHLRTRPRGCGTRRAASR